MERLSRCGLASGDADKTRLELVIYFVEMLMEDPVPTYTHIVRKLAERHPSLAFLDLVEPGVKGAGDGDTIEGQVSVCGEIIHQ